MSNSSDNSDDETNSVELRTEDQIPSDLKAQPTPKTGEAHPVPVTATEETSEKGMIVSEEVKRKKKKEEIKTCAQLGKMLKPRCSPILWDKKVHLFTLKWHSIHVARSIGISAILVLLLYAFSSLPYTRPIQTGYWHYYNAYSVAFGFAAFTAFVYILFSYGFFVLLYGFAKTRLLLAVAIPGLLWAVGNWFVFIYVGLEPWWYGLDLVSYAVFALLVISSCVIMNRVFKQHKRNFLVVFGIPILVHMVIIALYAYVVLPFYRAISPTGNGAFLRFVFRIVVHPIINVINLLTTQAFVHQFESVDPPFLATGYALGILVEGSYIGRLMTITIGTTDQNILTAVALGLAQILLRSSHSRIFKTVEFIRKKICTCACIIEEDIIDWESEKHLRAAYMHYYMTVENSGVVVITSMFILFWKHRQVWNLAYSDYPSSEPPFLTLIYSALIQLAINFCVDYIATIVERTEKIYPFTAMRQEPFRMLVWEVLNMIQMMLLIIYINRMLPFSAFCGQLPEQKLDPCFCRIGIDFSVFNTTCNGTHVNPAIMA